jgi:hypothetical protein
MTYANQSSTHSFNRGLMIQLTPLRNLVKQSLAVIKGVVEPVIADLERRLGMARGALEAEVKYLDQRAEENERRSLRAHGADAAWHNAKADTYRRTSARLVELLAQIAAPLAPVEGTWSWARSRLERIPCQRVSLSDWPADSWLEITDYLPLEIVIHNEYGYHQERARGF